MSTLKNKQPANKLPAAPAPMKVMLLQSLCYPNQQMPDFELYFGSAQQQIFWIAQQEFLSKQIRKPNLDL